MVCDDFLAHTSDLYAVYGVSRILGKRERKAGMGMTSGKCLIKVIMLCTGCLLHHNTL